MKLNRKIEAEMADKFEGILDRVPALDKVPFYIKREAVLVAAKVAFEHMRLSV